jgi:hypothetical protein
MKCDNTAVGYCQQLVPKMLQTMEGLLEQVCGAWRGLLSRKLGLQHHRLGSLFFLALGQILFDQAIYVIWKYSYSYTGQKFVPSVTYFFLFYLIFHNTWIYMCIHFLEVIKPCSSTVNIPMLKSGITVIVPSACAFDCQAEIAMHDGKTEV